ncbi:MAG TPA: DegT/DnrJ/EryC1/StrS family aminotransferase [Thermomicrobiales bacterium]|nr:DegT/DnrJ/EryC1/StrS family aminotransferase [Thermomicrobiales bacterium]
MRAPESPPPARVPVADARREYRARRAELDAAIARVLDRGWFVLGAEVAAFEAEFAAYLGAGHAVGVASGTDAIELALRALDIGPGDEVLVPAMTAAFSALAVGRAGAAPVFADVDRATGALDPAAAAARVTPRTRALLAVHLYGGAADLAALGALAARHGLALVEDAAQAHGAAWRGRRLGAVGALGCFSFYPSKNLGAYGDGGAVVTADPALAARLRRLRDGGQAGRYAHVELGVNSRLDELQAAVLRVKLRHLDAGNAARRARAARYDAALAGTGLALPAARPESAHAYHLYAARVPGGRRAALAARGVATQVHYPVPVPLQAAYAALGHRPGDFPAADAWAAEELSLPLFPELTAAEQDRVVAAIREWAGVGEGGPGG